MAIVTTFVDNMPTAAKLDNDLLVIQNTLDFAKVNVAASDVVQALKVPADCLVTKVAVYVITAEGATSTCTVGDGDGANSWDASVNLNSAGGYYSAAGTDAYAQGKFYTVADTIDLTISADTALDLAKVHVVAFMANMQADLAA